MLQRRLIVLGSSVSTLLCVMLVVWLANAKVELVRVTGAERADSEEVRRLSQIRNGVFMGDISFRDVEQRIADHPWVESVSVSSSGFWRSMSIVVTEKRPIAVSRMDNDLVYVDLSGDIIAPVVMTDVDYPIITVISEDGALFSAEKQRARRADAVALILGLTRAGPLDGVGLSEVVLSESGETHVNLVNGSCLVVPLTQEGHRVARLSALVSRGAVHFGKRQMIDLTPRDVAVVTPLSIDESGCS